MKRVLPACGLLESCTASPGCTRAFTNVVAVFSHLRDGPDIPAAPGGVPEGLLIRAAFRGINADEADPPPLPGHFYL